MIASFHIADVGRLAGTRLLRSQPSPERTPGLRYAALMLTTPLSGRGLPRPDPRRLALFGAWEDERALERFQAEDPLAAALSAEGWRVRLQPTHLFGAWPELDPIRAEHEQMAATEPAAVLTLGRLRLSQAPRFIRAGAAAERLAADDEAMLRGIGMARPPGLVATFSVWRTTAEMRAYADGRAGHEHRDAVGAHHARPFHHRSAFVRFRPCASKGLWDGIDPLCTQATSATSPSSGLAAPSSR